MPDRTRWAGAQRNHLGIVCIGVSDGLRTVLGNGMVPSGKRALFLHYCRICRGWHYVSGSQSNANELGHPKESAFPLLALSPVAFPRNHDHRSVPHLNLIF